MRPILLFVFAFSNIFSVAQPTIVESSGPQVGTSWTGYFTDMTEGITIGNPGAAQNWIYTGFLDPFSTGTLDFIDPSTLPSGFDGFFPDAELALASDSSAEFYISEPDGLYYDGFASISSFFPPPNNVFDYQPDQITFPYDFTYQDVRNSQSAYESNYDGGTPVLVRTTIFTEIEGDGYGSLTTPGGTYADVLRIREFSFRIDSIFDDENQDGTYEFQSITGPEGTYSIDYHHVQNAEPFYLATFRVDSTETEMFFFRYFTEGPTDIPSFDSEDRAIIYPNPSQGLITIDLGEIQAVSSLIVHDLQGRVVYSMHNPSPSNRYEIDLTGLKRGLYMLIVQSEGQSWSKRVDIQ